jgi:hypothetical protein
MVLMVALTQAWSVFMKACKDGKIHDETGKRVIKWGNCTNCYRVGPIHCLCAHCYESQFTDWYNDEVHQDDNAWLFQ